MPANADVEVVWVEAALHVNLDRLENEIKTALAGTTIRDAKVHLLIGTGCHPDLVKMAQEYGTQVSPVTDCLEAFLGAKKREMEKNGTMIMTPGWIRAWPSMMAAMGWNEVDVRINYGRYNRILVLDPGINPLSDEEILEFFDLTQIPIEIEVLELQHFRNTLAALLH